MSSRRESLKALEGQYQPQNQSIANYLKSFNEMTEFSRTQEIQSAQFGNNGREKMRKQISISRSSPTPCELNKIPIPKFFCKRNFLEKQELIQEPPKQITQIRRTLINPGKQKKLNDTTQEATKFFIDQRKEYFIKKPNKLSYLSPPNQDLKFLKTPESNGRQNFNSIFRSTNRSFSQECLQNKREYSLEKSDSLETSEARNSKTPQPRKRQINIIINDIRLKFQNSSSPLSQVSKKYISPIFSLANRTSYDFPKSLQKSLLKGRSYSSHTDTVNNIGGQMRNKETDLQTIQKSLKPISENKLQAPCSSNDELTISEFIPKQMPRNIIQASSLIKLGQNQNSILSEVESTKQSVKKFKLLTNPIIAKIQSKQNDFSQAIEDPYQVKDRLNQQFQIMSAKISSSYDSENNLANQIKQTRSKIQSYHTTIFDSQKYLNARYNCRLYIPKSVNIEIDHIAKNFEENLLSQLNQK